MKRCPSCNREFTDSYTFCDQDGATLTSIASAFEARLIIHQSDDQPREIVLSAKPVTLGKTADNDIVILDGAISRKHARLERHGDSCFIKDLGSLNGTSVNGENIGEHERELKDGDEITVGRTKLSFRLIAVQPEPLADLQKTAEDEVPRVTTVISPVVPPPAKPAPPTPPSIISTEQQPPSEPLPPPRITALFTDPSQIVPPTPATESAPASYKVAQTGELLGLEKTEAVAANAQYLVDSESFIKTN